MDKETEQAIKEVCALGEKHNPMLVTANRYPIHEWLNQGADLKQDIIPAVTELIMYAEAKGNTIGGYAYFSGKVLELKNARVSEQKKTEMLSRDLPVDYLAKIYAWKRKWGMKLMEDQRELLAMYEEKHGRLPGKSLKEWGIA